MSNSNLKSVGLKKSISIQGLASPPQAQINRNAVSRESQRSGNQRAASFSNNNLPGD